MFRAMLDSLNEAILLLNRFHRDGDEIDFKQVVEFIVGQQVRFGNDAGIFIESRDVSRPMMRTYTGEKLQTHLAAKNILTVEAVRALILSGSSTPHSRIAIEITDKWLEKQCFSDFCTAGECKHSSIAFIRYLNACRKSKRVEDHIAKLSKFRDGKGGWKGFPYFYTLLALSEIDSPSADTELQYAFANAEQRFKNSRSEELYNSRRNEILAQVQNRFGQLLLTSKNSI